MALPHVSVSFSNGNLLADVSVIDGIAGLAVTVATTGLIGVVNIINNLDDAVTSGYTIDAEPFAYRQIKEFYDEVGGNQKLYVMGTAETMSMAGALDNTDNTGAKKLVAAANGQIRLLGVCRKPASAYAPGTDFMDADVALAITAAGTFCGARLTELIPLRVLIEGRVTGAYGTTVFAPNTATIGSAGVVLGGSANDGSASVGTALGRAVKYGAQIKIGKVANGPLSIPQVYIGTQLLKDVTNLVSLHDAGYISFMQHPNKAGIYFGIDHMASNDDFRLLAYGRVIDKAAIISAAVYVDEIEGEVTINADGTIDQTDLEHLKGVLTQQINLNMADQISGLLVTIDPTQNITANSTLVVKEKIQPLGYKSFIEIELGLNAPVAS